MIATSIRRQRFILQQLIHALDSHRDGSEVVWYRPIAELLRQRYGTFSRRWSGDFLLQDPPKPPGWRQTMLPQWWRKVLLDWKRIPWAKQNSLQPTRAKIIQHALFSPIWWNTSSEFQVRRTDGDVSTPLGAGTFKFKCLCRELASKQKWCLADFLENSYQWPTPFAFMCGIRREIRPLLDSRVLVSDILVLYHQLTQIFYRVLPHPEAGGVAASVRSVFPPVLGVKAGNGTHYFPNRRKQDWDKVLHPAFSVNVHPMRELGCPQARIHSTRSEYILLRRCRIPVVHDVMLRLFFGDLIVGSRLYFLKSMNPTVQECVQNSCTAIETVRHCFFTCPALMEMWQSLWIPWSKAFSVTLEWRLLLWSNMRDINVEWRQQHKLLLMLWRIHTAIVFHATWRLRNDILFQEAQAECPSIQTVATSFRRHCQFIFRHATEPGIDGDEVVDILHRLGFDAPTVLTLPPPERRIWIPRL